VAPAVGSGAFCTDGPPASWHGKVHSDITYQSKVLADFPTFYDAGSCGSLMARR
jgi:hypothetical protein